VVPVARKPSRVEIMRAAAAAADGASAAAGHSALAMLDGQQAAAEAPGSSSGQLGHTFNTGVQSGDGKIVVTSAK
jgi:hypothetical protein